MARNREAVVLLLDVGPSMHGVLQEVEKVCSMLVQKKLIYGKSDEVAVVVFGTGETNNELQKEVGGYEHVVVLRKIKVVDGEAIDTLQNLPRGTVPGDCIRII
ncbi:ATP-dependent DNA helicase 2 subunit KU80-like [Ananas comosus]|uniref:ATP-dependent DNA helicase 2 subunit KU80-like n=1 Tax=Ananas comosus TaxID=4615 RepID=A0A6P5G0A4_ANACO|nr:ATP-dependent DNA helicase 2 subunit KU80-like [Ananas comosus]